MIVSKWESAQSCPDIQLLPDLAKIFNVSVDELLGYTLVSTSEDEAVSLKKTFSGGHNVRGCQLFYELLLDSIPWE